MVFDNKRRWRALFAAALLVPPPRGYACAVYHKLPLIGGEVVWSALKNIARGKVFDENFLMSLATVCAFAIGEYPEAVAVMLFYQIGEIFQNAAVPLPPQHLCAPADTPRHRQFGDADGTMTVPPEMVGVGELILVRLGERVPLDGVVLKAHLL